MKYNIKPLIMIMAFVLLAQTAPAQSKLDKLMTETTPEERAEMKAKNLQEKLSLSEDQYQQVHEINLKYANKMQNIYSADQGKLQRLKSMKALSEDKDREMKQVLSSQQYEAYREEKEKMKEGAKERRKSGSRN